MVTKIEVEGAVLRQCAYCKAPLVMINGVVQKPYIVFDAFTDPQVIPHRDHNCPGFLTGVIATTTTPGRFIATWDPDEPTAESYPTLSGGWKDVGYVTDDGL